jgi:hypothetical protein
MGLGGKDDVATSVLTERARSECARSMRAVEVDHVAFPIIHQAKWWKVDKEGYVKRCSLTVKRLEQTFLRFTNNDSRITVTS